MSDTTILLPPNDNTDWFQKHILEKLKDLDTGLRGLVDVHTKHSESLRSLIDSHTAADTKEFEAIKRELESMRPVKTIVYAAVSMVLITVFGAMIFYATGQHFKGF